MPKNRIPGRIVLFAVFGFLYLPVAVLVLLSFNSSGLPTTWTGFSTKWYGALVSNEKILGAAANTLIVAVCATLLSTVLGTLLALGMEARARKSGTLEALAFAPMVIPDIVLAVALLSFFSKLNVTLGLHTIIISHVIFDLAFVCSVVRARLKNFDYSIVEASRDLGASGWTTFWRVTFPSIMPEFVPAGPYNPLGARALYLHREGHDTLYRIHGTNDPKGVGFDGTSGCFRLTNTDVVDLFKRVPVGTKVVVE